VKVFFVFREFHKNKPGLYTLWGKTTIATVDSSAGTDGYYFIHFDQFEPAPRRTWKGHLTAEEIVGERFGRGIVRYISDPIADELDKMIPGA
jgi:hypothetical protein